MRAGETQRRTDVGRLQGHPLFRIFEGARFQIGIRRWPYVRAEFGPGGSRSFDAATGVQHGDQTASEYVYVSRRYGLEADSGGHRVSVACPLLCII